MKIYIAGPYSKGDPVLNVRSAVLTANEVLALGHYPFIPHLTHLWHMVTPKPYEEWLHIDLVWLEMCDAVLRIPGESSGADIEVAKMRELGKPVYYSISEIKRHAIV